MVEGLAQRVNRFKSNHLYVVKWLRYYQHKAQMMVDIERLMGGDDRKLMELLSSRL